MKTLSSINVLTFRVYILPCIMFVVEVVTVCYDVHLFVAARECYGPISSSPSLYLGR